MSRKQQQSAPGSGASGIRRNRKAVEGAATFGLILVAVGLAAPFTDLLNSDYIRIFKWIYAPGALIYTVARIAGSTDPQDSLRVRRLRRMEFWAGVAFCIGVFFWFYNEHRYADLLSMGAGAMVYLRETVYFTLAGALIQVIATYSLSSRLRKEKEGREKDKEEGGDQNSGR